jgi:septum formation protein
MWNNPDRPLILASNSPRRLEILSQMGFSCTVVSPRIDDERRFFCGGPFESEVSALALAKAQSVAHDHPDSLVLGGDTIVCIGSTVMGKPSGRDEARQMLRTLSGAIHKVYSGVALVCGTLGFARAEAACTRVAFRILDDSEIERYLDCGEYSDKAGAYAIQGKAMMFIDKIDGCFYNVVGLPVAQTINLFKLYLTRKDQGNDRH